MKKMILALALVALPGLAGAWQYGYSNPYYVQPYTYGLTPSYGTQDSYLARFQAEQQRRHQENMQWQFQQKMMQPSMSDVLCETAAMEGFRGGWAPWAGC